MCGMRVCCGLCNGRSRLKERRLYIREGVSATAGRSMESESLIEEGSVSDRKAMTFLTGEIGQSQAFQSNLHPIVMPPISWQSRMSNTFARLLVVEVEASMDITAFPVAKIAV